jgi:hypothetical protein
MKAVKFKKCNTEFAKNQDEYFTLPAHVTDDELGIVTTCWKINFKERIKILLFGKIYLQILTFLKPLQPLKMLVDNPIKKEE